MCMLFILKWSVTSLNYEFNMNLILSPNCTVRWQLHLILKAFSNASHSKTVTHTFISPSKSHFVAFSKPQRRSRLTLSGLFCNYSIVKHIVVVGLVTTSLWLSLDQLMSRQTVGDINMSFFYSVGSWWKYFVTDCSMHKQDDRQMGSWVDGQTDRSTAKQMLTDLFLSLGRWTDWSPWILD